MIVGDCATGKTSLASEIGGYALTKLAKVQYITQEDLLLAIRNQSPRWKKILKSEMLIIDDVLYIAPTDAELTTFYKAITFLSETHSLVIVTNRKLGSFCSQIVHFAQQSSFVVYINQILISNTFS